MKDTTTIIIDTKTNTFEENGFMNRAKYNDIQDQKNYYANLEKKAS